MNVKFFLFLFALVAAGERTFSQTPVWTQMPGSPSGTTRHDDIYFIDETTGWSARGLGGIFKTTNGGATWIQKTNMPTTHFRSIGFLTDQHGFAGNLGAGSYDINVKDTNNVLYETFDGGETWANHPGLFEAGMKGFCAMHVLDPQHIYGVGRVRGPAHFAKSEDGGTNWTVVNLSPTVGADVGLGVMGGMMDVYFKDPTNGFAVGMDTNTFASGLYHGRIAKTTDGGATWTAIADTGRAFSYFWKMSWPTPNVGYASLQQNAGGTTPTSLIFYKTIDGGNTWVSNGIPYSAIGISSFTLLQGIGFITPNEGWAGGPSSSSAFAGTFLHTTNGGVSWTPEGYNNSSSINRIRFYPKFAVASGAKLHFYKVPLLITTQPQSQTNATETTAVFNVTGQGTAPLVFQWRFNGTNLTGANTNFYSIANVQTTNAGDYDVVMSDFSGSVTSAVAVLSIAGAPAAPSITAPPQNQVVNAGSSATFSVAASGTAPLNFQWRFNGADIFNATNTSIAISNVQQTNAGNYFVVVTNSAGSVTSAVATLTVLSTNNLLFAGDFENYSPPSIVTNTGTTNGYKIFFGAISGAEDFRVIFGFDYSTVTLPINIPPAPNSIGGSTKGLFLAVNKDATGFAAAVNLYPVGLFTSNNFSLKFDMWLNWTNLGSSTEHALFGINHSGNITNRVAQTNSDGLFFAMDGDGNATSTATTSRDYSVFRGGGNGAIPIFMTTNNTTFGPTPLLGPQFDNGNSGFVNLFPAKSIPGYPTTPAGTPGLGWVTGEIRQENNLITWLLNGATIAQYTNTFAYTNGDIMIGYNDTFDSLGNTNNFVIFDNVRVENIVPLPVTLISPRMVGNDFSFSFVTETNASYTVQQSTNLAVSNWVPYLNFFGNGNLTNILVPLTNNMNPQFFRVRRP